MLSLKIHKVLAKKISKFVIASLTECDKSSYTSVIRTGSDTET